MQSECTSQLESPDELEKEADNDDDDGVASMTSSVLHGACSVHSSTSQSLLGKRKSKTKSGAYFRAKSGAYFRAWSFQIRVQANFPPASSTAGERRTFLFEHLSLCTAHKRPNCITSLTVFCDESHFSGHTDSAGLVSLEIHGYVQTKDAVSLTTMEKWIGSASWKPVLGGLMSDDDFKYVSVSRSI